MLLFFQVWPSPEPPVLLVAVLCPLVANPCAGAVAAEFCGAALSLRRQEGGAGYCAVPEPFKPRRCDGLAAGQPAVLCHADDGFSVAQSIGGTNGHNLQESDQRRHPNG